MVGSDRLAITYWAMRQKRLGGFGHIDIVVQGAPIGLPCSTPPIFLGNIVTLTAELC